jgi:hypothetical protein
MPTWYPCDDVQRFIQCALIDHYDSFDDPEFKNEWRNAVLQHRDSLYEFVCDEIMPMLISDWNIDTNQFHLAIMNSIDFNELLEDIGEYVNDPDN